MPRAESAEQPVLLAGGEGLNAIEGLDGRHRSCRRAELHDRQAPTSDIAHDLQFQFDPRLALPPGNRSRGLPDFQGTVREKGTVPLSGQGDDKCASPRPVNGYPTTQGRVGPMPIIISFQDMLKLTTKPGAIRFPGGAEAYRPSILSSRAQRGILRCPDNWGDPALRMTSSPRRVARPTKPRASWRDRPQPEAVLVVVRTALVSIDRNTAVFAHYPGSPSCAPRRTRHNTLYCNGLAYNTRAAANGPLGRQKRRRRVIPTTNSRRQRFAPCGWSGILVVTAVAKGPSTTHHRVGVTVHEATGKLVKLHDCSDLRPRDRSLHGRKHD